MSITGQLSLIALLSSCCSHSPAPTWGDAVAAWGDAWCARQVRCEPNPGPLEACQALVVTANCNVQRYDCDAPYPYQPQLFEDCADEVTAETCEPTAKSMVCTEAFKEMQ